METPGQCALLQHCTKFSQLQCQILTREKDFEKFPIPHWNFYTSLKIGVMKSISQWLRLYQHNELAAYFRLVPWQGDYGLTCHNLTFTHVCSSIFEATMVSVDSYGSFKLHMKQNTPEYPDEHIRSLENFLSLQTPFIWNFVQIHFYNEKWSSCWPQGVAIIAYVRYLHDQINVNDGIVTLGTTVCVKSAQGCDNKLFNTLCTMKVSLFQQDHFWSLLSRLL